MRRSFGYDVPSCQANRAGASVPMGAAGRPSVCVSPQLRCTTLGLTTLRPIATVRASSMTALAAPASLKLPVWHTVRACYATVARNLGQLVRISWLWLLIMLPVYAAINWMDWALREASGVLSPGDLIAVIELPFLASIAVAWHRLILREERVTAPAYLRLDGMVWLYALYSLLLMILVAAPSVPLLIRIAHDGALGGPVTLGGPVAVMQGANRDLVASFAFVVAVQAIVILLSVMVAVLVPRLSLVLPALAVGERLSPVQSWRMTRGNTLRLALATLLCTLPAYLLVVLVLLAFSWDWNDGLEDRVPFVAAGLIMSVGFAVLAILAVTLLSLTYRFFAGQREASAAPPA